MIGKADCKTCGGTGTYLMGEALPIELPMRCPCTLGECTNCNEVGFLGSTQMCETCEENSDLCVGCRGRTEDQMRAEIRIFGDLAFCWLHAPIRPDDPGRAVLEENELALAAPVETQEKGDQ